MSARPSDPSIVVYAPGFNCIVKRADRRVVYQYSQGLAYVDKDVFCWSTSVFGKDVVGIRVPVSSIQSVTLEGAFVDTNVYHLPCYYCTCYGCPDGMVDVKGTIDGVQFHAGIAMPDAQDFVDRLNAEIQKRKEPF